MRLAELSENLWALLLTAVYVLLLLEGTCLLLDRRERKRPWLAVAVVLSFLVLAVLLTGFYQQDMGWVQLVFAVFMKLPAWGLFLLLVLAYGGVLALIWRDHRYRRSTITRAAVKESVDNLPTGLCFSDRSGAVLLANRRMLTLCHQVTGAELQDAEAFWAVLERGPLAEGIERISGGKDVMLRLPEGAVWTFGRNMIQAGDETVVELSAADTTDLYGLTCQLQENNRALAEMNRRLRKHSENVDALVHSRERLATKIRIHDDFGQALLATRYLLTQQSAEADQGELLTQWKRIVAVLRREAEPVQAAGSWENLLAVAEASGVRVVLTGRIPADDTARMLLLGATAEALTNAVRHGDATVLDLSVTERDGTCTARFTNNGTVPQGPIALGGGLGTLQRRLRDAGGTLAVEAEPVFALTVTLPAERRDTP